MTAMQSPSAERPLRDRLRPLRAWDRPSRWNAAMVVLPALAVAVLGWRHRALTDDGTIFLRTVRQILAGHGPVVNHGERVEANTSTLWQWLLVVLGPLIPGEPGFTAVVAGLVCTTAGVLVALDATRRLYAGVVPRALMPAGVLVLLAVPVYWDFATGGLDSGLGTLWLAGCWWFLVRSYVSPEARGQAGHAVWFGLGVLVRPEFALVTVVFLAASWALTRPGPRRTAGGLAAAAALPVGYEIFRAGYYGLLVPLPALTKEAGDSETGRGLRYAWDFAEPVALYVPAALFVALLAVWAFRSRPAPRRLLVVLAPVAAALILTCYLVRVGGDYMHGRMMLPVMFLALLPGLLLPASARVTAVAAATAVWGVAVVGPWHPAAYHDTDRSLTVRVRDSDIRLTGVANPDRVGEWTAAFPELRSAVAAGLAADRPVLVRLSPDGGAASLLPLAPVHASGRVAVPGGYLGVTGELVPLDEYIVELWGLANTIGAHLDYAPGAAKKWPGHRKFIDDVWLAALELHPSVTHLPDNPAVTPESLAAARHALSCGDVRELLDSVRKPLTVARFVDNLIGAYERTRLRIPRDPFAAERRFCGTP
ncbi:MAG TPA: hypothetical protein VLH10_25440 [Yinghuangia sp.]|uniref:hypothetical protein n=1 Tax=Yinghuangia sp. YIM S10712 TaxID=3436930 RepID=UPI002C63819F|nr:hypothetical protein [Yinghuangia sp.]